jgi:hypothetical protein
LFHPTEKFFLIPDSDAVDSLNAVESRTDAVPEWFYSGAVGSDMNDHRLDFVGSFEKPQARVDGNEHHFIIVLPIHVTLGFHEADYCKPVIGDVHIFSNGWLGFKKQCRPGSFP